MCTYCYGSRISCGHTIAAQKQRMVKAWNDSMTPAEEIVIKRMMTKVHTDLMQQGPTTEVQWEVILTWEQMCRNLGIEETL